MVHRADRLRAQPSYCTKESLNVLGRASFPPGHLPCAVKLKRSTPRVKAKVPAASPPILASCMDRSGGVPIVGPNRERSSGPSGTLTGAQGRAGVNHRPGRRCTKRGCYPGGIPRMAEAIASVSVSSRVKLTLCTSS